MPRNIFLIIFLLILIFFALGTATFYFSLKEKGKKIEKEEKTATLPKAPQTKKTTPEPEKITTQLQEPSTTEPTDTSDWKIYRSKKWGFEIKYPSHLQIGKTLFDQPFNPGLEGSILTTFSDKKTDELVIALSLRSLDGYIIRDHPAGIYYRFDQKENRWIPSVQGQIIGKEPKLLDLAITAYGYRSGDGKCLWHEAVVPHPTENYVFEFVFVTCVDEGQQPGALGRIPDLTPILATIIFSEPRLDLSGWKIYRNKKFGFEVIYPPSWYLHLDRLRLVPGEGRGASFPRDDLALEFFTPWDDPQNWPWGAGTIIFVGHISDVPYIVDEPLCITVTKAYDISIANIEGKAFEGVTNLAISCQPEGRAALEIVVIKGKYYYSFFTIKQEERLSIFYQILKSFRFTQSEV